MIVDADTNKWARVTLVIGILLLVGTVVTIGFTIYGATQKELLGVEVALNVIQILLIAAAGGAALLAWRKRTKWFVVANLASIALLTLFALIVLILVVAAPKAGVEAMIDGECQKKNLTAEQCDIVKRFSLATSYILQVLTFCYCLCYLGVAGLFFRAVKRNAIPTVRVEPGAVDYGVPSAEGFDDFPSADRVPMLSVSANVI